MLQIIPAIDLRGGRCVRLYQGDYARETVFGDDPAEMARHWESLGAERLHVVDLDGARQGSPVQLALVGRIVGAVEIPIQLGGGLRSAEDVRAAFEVGIDRAVLGTAAIGSERDDSGRAFRLACLAVHSERLVIGLDARDGRLAVQGWTESTSIDAFELAGRLRGEGFQRIIYTDISCDGALSGPNIDHLRRLAAIPGLAVIASGGIASLADLEALIDIGTEGAIVGQALYTSAISFPEAIEMSRSGRSRTC